MTPEEVESIIGAQIGHPEIEKKYEPTTVRDYCRREPKRAVTPPYNALGQIIRQVAYAFCWTLYQVGLAFLCPW